MADCSGTRYLEIQGMQLDLFLDNRRTILNNLADEHLRKLELEEAATLYDRILAEAADDPAIVSAKQALETWRKLLQHFYSSPPGADRIYALYRNLAEPAPAPLKAGFRSFIMEQLELEESPELIFIPPRFHLGCLLLETGRAVEAETWFSLALDSGIAEQVRFLAYLGDALNMKSETDTARDCYRDAFLEDPHGVDLDHLRDRTVREMPMEMEEEGLSEEEALRWIPVWGWLKGIFTLGPADMDDPRMLGDEFSRMLESQDQRTAPRLWFECLRHAERLRTGIRDDGELVRMRRKMKELNPVLFGKYMEKIRG
jgi:tetratricopeptide (TPR) repeat protein